MAAAARSATRAFARSNLRPAARSSRFALPIQTARASGRRGYSSEANAPKSNSTLFIGLGLAAAGGAGYYFYSNGDASASASYVPGKDDYQKVYNEIARLLVEKDDYDDGSYGPVRYITTISESREGTSC